MQATGSMDCLCTGSQRASQAKGLMTMPPRSKCAIHCADWPVLSNNFRQLHCAIDAGEACFSSRGGCITLFFEHCWHSMHPLIKGCRVYQNNVHEALASAAQAALPQTCQRSLYPMSKLLEGLLASSIRQLAAR